MTEPIKRDIIDNTHEFTMKNILNSEIPNTNKLNISTGYFDVAGYGLLKESLEQQIKNKLFEMKILLGKEAILPTKDSFEKYAQQYNQDNPDIRSLKSSLDDAELSPQSKDDTSSLIKLLEHDNIQVRLGANRFNHSKCYILGKNASFIGSSNFTAAGLVGNYELNASVYQQLPIEQTQKWFDRMWEMGTDTKQDLIKILTQSKFGIPPPPFEVYMKMLFELYKPLLVKNNLDTKYSETLTQFQKDAVQSGLLIISDFGGAMIADATGLGKTNMGIEILRQKVLKEGKKVLLIAPAQVLHSMWSEKLKDVDINVREKLTMESLGRDEILNDIQKYRNIDFILIDESQNFRSRTAQRRQNLMKLMSVGKRKQSVLLSATPVNNSIMDLYYQLSIITGEDDSYFYRTIGIPDLYKHMKDAADSEGLQRGLVKIQMLLDNVMVRRTRSYIKDVYPKDQINGQDIKFPSHEYQPIHYNLSDLFGNVFEDIVNAVKSLEMAPYGIERYNTSLSEEEKKKHQTLAHLQVILLLKRFESSVVAVSKSIDNKIKLYEYIRKIVNQGEIVHVKDFNKILTKWNTLEMTGDSEDNDDEENKTKKKKVKKPIDEESQTKFFLDEIAKLPHDSLGKNYNVIKLKEDLDSDLEILKDLKVKIDDVTNTDTKIQSVIAKIVDDKALEKESKKILIFTEYTTTAKYIEERMTKRFPNNTVRWISGNTDQKTRKAYIRRFAPKSNLLEDEQLDKPEIDILISTEVLSEGQNLQDCNYVINYDLPWNPMKIVQRTGRVDRLTNNFDVIHSRACYPDKQLDEILKLVGKLIEKIGTANATVGLDVELLGVPANEKQFNKTLVDQIKILASSGDAAGKTIEELQRASDIMPLSSPLSELTRYVKEKGIDMMQEIPMGRRSGEKGENPKVVLAYLQEKPKRRVYFVNYDFRKDTAYVSDDSFDVMNTISCRVDTETYLPIDGPDNSESFKMLLDIDVKARTAIEEKNNTVFMNSIAGRKNRRSKFDTDKKKIQDILANAEGIKDDDAETVFTVLQSNDLAPWANEINGYLSEYERSDDVDGLINSILQTCKCMGLSERELIDEKESELSEPKLVGAMFILSGESDPTCASKEPSYHGTLDGRRQ